jgi:transposase
MKDGRTHLAHKAEHAVDLSTGALLSVTLQPADQGDTATIFETLDAADIAAQKIGQAGIKEVVADKGYHSAAVLVDLRDQDIRSYVCEPDRGRRRWRDKPGGQQQQVYSNRRRLRGGRNAQLQRKRQELAERSFAHMYETGAMRRLHLRGRTNILKRLVVHGAGFNLGLYMRSVIGVGKPRQLTLTTLKLLFDLVIQPSSLRSLSAHSFPARQTLGAHLPSPFAPIPFLPPAA